MDRFGQARAGRLAPGRYQVAGEQFAGARPTEIQRPQPRLFARHGQRLVAGLPQILVQGAAQPLTFETTSVPAGGEED